jgi:hypothetical protein
MITESRVCDVISTICVQGLCGALPFPTTLSLICTYSLSERPGTAPWQSELPPSQAATRPARSLGGIDVLRQRAVFVASCKPDSDPSYVSAELKSPCEPLNGFCTR